jgi:hypothetical protein
MLSNLLFVGLLLGIAPYLNAGPPSGVTFFSPRSQVVNAAQELIRDQQFIYQNDVVCEQLFDMTLGYAHSFNADRLATIIFGNYQFTVSGSELVDRNVNDFLADYFGLSPTFKSTLQVKPEIQNIILPATLYYGFGDICAGLYIRLQLPFVFTSSKVWIDEEVISNGSETPFPPDYMALGSVTSPYQSFAQVLHEPLSFGAMQEPRRFGSILCHSAHINTLANCTFDLGWNHFFTEDRGSHIGIKFRVVTPNSTRPKNRLLFEPIAGNGYHWELGVGLNGHILLWTPDEQQQLDLYLNLLITSLLTSHQHRTFDLKDRPQCSSKFFSRYMLVKKFDSTGMALGELAPLINYSMLACRISTPAQFDGTIMFSYNRKYLTFDIGYNGWIRSKENIKLCQELPYNALALKGIQNTFTPTGQPSSITESNATIFGTFIARQGAVADPLSPKFINTQDIDPYSARSPLVLTHKIFFYLGYTGGKLHKTHQWQPFVGIGGEFEFEGINDLNNYEPPTAKNTMAQWSFWLRGGFLFG